MESQEKIHVPIFTGINKDIFLQEIYPQVRRNFSMLRFLWMSMCPQSPYLWLSVLLLFIFSPSANQPSWEGLIWGHVWKNGQLNISDREEQIRKWRSTYPLSHRWTFFTKTLCTSELPHTQTHTDTQRARPGLSLAGLFTGLCHSVNLWKGHLKENTLTSSCVR